MASYGIGLHQPSGTYTVWINGKRAVTVPTCEAALAFVDLDRELRHAGLAHPAPKPMEISPCPLVVKALMAGAQ